MLTRTPIHDPSVVILPSDLIGGKNAWPLTSPLPPSPFSPKNTPPLPQSPPPGRQRPARRTHTHTTAQPTTACHTAHGYTWCHCPATHLPTRYVSLIISNYCYHPPYRCEQVYTVCRGWGWGCSYRAWVELSDWTPTIPCCVRGGRITGQFNFPAVLLSGVGWLSRRRVGVGFICVKCRLLRPIPAVFRLGADAGRIRFHPATPRRTHNNSAVIRD